MIRFSVVIPAYNNKLLLNNTLEALNDQLDYEAGSYEVIVVDDGSSDNTLQHIEATPRTYDFHYIYLERTPESCRAKVRNTGWRKARGQFVVFLDADMIVNRNYLRELWHYFEQNEELLVISYRYMLKQPVALEDVRSGRLFEKNYRSLDYFEARHFDSQIHSFNLAALKHPWHCVYSCNMALSRSKLEQLDGFDEDYKGWGMEDTDIGYRCYLQRMSIVSHLGVEALHQYHGEAFGDLKNQDKMNEWDQNIARMYKKFPQLHKVLPRWRINFAYFTRRVPYMLMRSTGNVATYQFTAAKEEDLPELKAKIVELSSKPGSLIIVQDELESADFHLWVQLLGYTASEVRYYPRSYIFDRKEIEQFLGSVFTWDKLLVMSYRCMVLLGNRMIRLIQKLAPQSAAAKKQTDSL